jgi:hypothetical protein
MVGYFCAPLDRSKIGVAATTTVKDFGLSNATFSFEAGLFSLGIVLAKIPSNLNLNKMEAPSWLARIPTTECGGPEVLARRGARRTKDKAADPPYFG